MTLYSRLLWGVLLLPFFGRSAASASHYHSGRRQASNSSAAAPRSAFGLKTDGTTVTPTGISVGFHIDWIAGEKPQELNAKLGKPAAVHGGYIHLQLNSQNYSELAAQAPSILALAQTSIYSPAVLPQFQLSQWTPAMSQALADQCKALNDQGVVIWLRFAYEMNGDWMDFGQDPVNYVAAWRDVTNAIRATTNQTYMLWSPNVYRGDVGALNGYTQYYPGATYVDLAGLSFYSLGNNQVENTLPTSNYFQLGFQTFYNLYAQDHYMVLSETSAPFHYLVPPQFANLPHDSELPNGGANGVNFTTLTPAAGSATELEHKTAWFEQLAGAATANLFPKLLAVFWFNLAKIGGENEILRLNDYRAVQGPNDPVTQYFRSAIGNQTAFELGLTATPTPSTGSSAVATSSATSAASTTSGGSGARNSAAPPGAEGAWRAAVLALALTVLGTGLAPS